MNTREKAEVAAVVLVAEFIGSYVQCKTWEQVKLLVDSGHEPEKVIITGTSWHGMAEQMPAGLDLGGPYGKIQMLPKEDAEDYLEKMKERLGQKGK